MGELLQGESRLVKLRELALDVVASVGDDVAVDELNVDSICEAGGGIWVQAWVRIDNETLQDHNIQVSTGV